MSESTPKSLNYDFQWFSPRYNTRLREASAEQGGGVPENEQYAKVPFRACPAIGGGFRG